MKFWLPIEPGGIQGAVPGGSMNHPRVAHPKPAPSRHVHREPLLRADAPRPMPVATVEPRVARTVTVNGHGFNHAGVRPQMTGAEIAALDGYRGGVTLIDARGDRTVRAEDVVEVADGAAFTAR